MNQLKHLNSKQKAFVAFLVIATLASIAGEFFGHHEEGGAHHWWASIPLFWILFGGIGCAVITLFAKSFLGKFIYKKEDYYNE